MKRQQLAFDRFTTWKPGTTQTKVVFHIFSKANPNKLLGQTTSLEKAEAVVAGKLSIKAL